MWSAHTLHIVFFLLAVVQWLFHVDAWSITKRFQPDPNSWAHDQGHPSHLGLRHLEERDECKTATVVAGDSCDSLAARCEIPVPEFMEFNTKPDLCSTLVPDQQVCCSKGTPPGETPESGKETKVPKPGEDGSCALHPVKDGESCEKVADKYGISVEDIEKYNKDREEGWSGCAALTPETDMCVSEGKYVDGTSSTVEVGKGDGDDDDDTSGDDAPSESDDAPATVPSAGYHPGKENKPKHECAFFDPPDWDATRNMCKETCKDLVEEELKKDEIASHGCVGNYPLDEPIPYETKEGLTYALGVCVCNSEVLKIFFEFFLEAMAAIGQIGCFILMQGLNLILNVAVDLIPGGAALKTGVQGIVNAATYADYTYDSDNDPAGAFDFFLSPCGGTDLVPDDLKKGFDIAIGIAGGKFKGYDVDKPPKPKWKKGSGKKGDDGNPKKDDKPSKTKTNEPEKTGSCEKPDNIWLIGEL